jgi:hypothetical protein
VNQDPAVTTAPQQGRAEDGLGWPVRRAMDRFPTFSTGLVAL